MTSLVNWVLIHSLSFSEEVVLRRIYYISYFILYFIFFRGDCVEEDGTGRRLAKVLNFHKLVHHRWRLKFSILETKTILVQVGQVSVSEWLSSLATLGDLYTPCAACWCWAWSVAQFPLVEEQGAASEEGRAGRRDKKRLRLINWGGAWTRTNLHQEHGWGCEEKKKKMGKHVQPFRQIMAAAIALLSIFASSGKKRIFYSRLPIQFGHFIVATRND